MGSPSKLVACALWRRPTSFPSSAAFGHPLSSARLSTAGGDPHRARRTDQDLRSDAAPRRAGAVPKTGMPFTVTSKEEGGGKSAICVRRFSRSRRPHVAQRVVLDSGIARSRCGHPRVHDVIRENERLLVSRAECLELTSQAHVRGRPARPSTRTDCLARIAPAAAP
jgi:hypothetical protein